MQYKYDISILAVFKNEESFLQEWVDHYLNRNIDHIFLLNDNSADSSAEIINRYIDKNKITLLNVENTTDEIGINWRQQYLYNKYYSYVLKQTKWIGIFDLDEFCYSPHTTDLKNIIKEYDNSNIQELIVDWYWFGSNGYLKQPKNIIDSFILRSKYLSKIISKDTSISSMGYHYDWCCKSFAKTKNISSLRHHYNKFKIYNKEDYVSHGKNKNFSMNLSDLDLMYINHYVGSKDYYFLNKVTRGSCNNSTVISSNKKKLYDMINLNEVVDSRLSCQNATLLTKQRQTDDT